MSSISFTYNCCQECEGKKSPRKDRILKECLYSHKEKPCTHVVCVGNYPNLSMFVQIGWGYHCKEKNKFSSDQNTSERYRFETSAFLHTLHSFVYVCLWPSVVFKLSISKKKGHEQDSSFQNTLYFP